MLRTSQEDTRGNPEYMWLFGIEIFLNLFDYPPFRAIHMTIEGVLYIQLTLTIEYHPW